MIAAFLNSEQAVLRTVERFRSLGYRETQHGVRLFGPVPHVAPQAWFHAIPRGLTDQEIGELSRALAVTFPKEYAAFLHAMNGAHFFADELALYGVRPLAAGRGIDSAFLPFDMADANGPDKPRRLRKGLFIIGSYKLDGSYVAMDSSTGHIERIERGTNVRLNLWPSLHVFLASEMQRLDRLHDHEAKLIGAKEEELVPPPDE